MRSDFKKWQICEHVCDYVLFMNELCIIFFIFVRAKRNRGLVII